MIFNYLFLTLLIIVGVLFRNIDHRINSQTQPSLYQVKEGSVYDGDTIRVIDSAGKEVKVRFACIDAPEMAQPLGKASRDHLRQLLAQHNNQVRLDITNTDRYGRSVAVVYLPNGQIVQQLQAQEGWVFPYPRYQGDCPVWNKVEGAGNTARQLKLNVHVSDDKPWEFRKK